MLARHSENSMLFSAAWCFKFCLIFPVVKFRTYLNYLYVETKQKSVSTSMNPSALPLRFLYKFSVELCTGHFAPVIKDLWAGCKGASLTHHLHHLQWRKLHNCFKTNVHQLSDQSQTRSTLPVPTRVGRGSKLLAPPPGPHPGGKGSNCLLLLHMGGDPPRTGTRRRSRPVSW